MMIYYGRIRQTYQLNKSKFEFAICHRVTANNFSNPTIYYALVHPPKMDHWMIPAWNIDKLLKK